MKLHNIYLILRHGQALANTLNVSDILGDPKNHLTEKGEQEAALAGQKLLSTPIDVIITSPFLRTKETTAIIARTIGFTEEKIVIEPRLREMNHGSLAQWKPIHYYSRKLTPKENLRHRDGADAESFLEVRARMLAVIHDCEERYKGKTLLIVSHRSPIWMLYTGYWHCSDEETIAWEKSERRKDSTLSSGGITSLNIPPEIPKGE